MIKKLTGLVGISMLVFLAISGCVRLQPGADPLVVRVEQTETIAYSTFDMVLNVNNANRPFWRTNAPPFHSFCEWLRQPITVNVTNTLPRAAAMIMQMNVVKNDYKAGKAGSNAVNTILITLQSALNQASAWSVIVTNNTVKLEN